MWGAVTLNPGCKNRCLFCGWRLLQKRPPKTKLKLEREGALKDLELLKEKGIRKIEISGSDPIEYDGTVSFVSQIKKMGFKTI